MAAFLLAWALGLSAPAAAHHILGEKHAAWKRAPRSAPAALKPSPQTVPAISLSPEANPSPPPSAEQAVRVVLPSPFVNADLAQPEKIAQ